MSFRLLLWWAVVCSAVNSVYSQKSQSTDSLHTFLDRVAAANSIDIGSVRAGYLVRQFRAGSAEKQSAVRAATIEGLRAASAYRRKYTKRIGIEVDEKKLDQELREKIERAKTETPISGKSVTTTFERYWVDGERFRIEKTFLDDERPLDQIRDDIKSGIIDINSPGLIQIVKQGRTAEIHSKRNGESVERSGVLVKLIPGRPQFLVYGRELTDSSLLDPIFKLELPVVLRQESSTSNRLVVQVGTKNSVGMLSTTTFNPDRGYFSEHSTIKLMGVLTQRSENSELHEMRSGIFLPGRSLVENYKINDRGVAELSLKDELLVVELPKEFKNEIDKVFTIPSDVKFEDLTVAKTVLPNDPIKVNHPHLEPKPSSPRPYRLVIIVLNGFLLIAACSIWYFRRRK